MTYNDSCPACGTLDLTDLPIPHPSRSVISDGSVIFLPLLRRSCNGCGYGFHAETFSKEKIREIYGTGYSIGLRDTEAEVARSNEYGRQIRSFLLDHLGNDAKFTNIIEFGCGTGTLLNHLHRTLGSDLATGVEPGERVANYARSTSREGVSIEHGFAESFNRNDQGYDLCFSVNVIEHTYDPLAFLLACKRAISDTGSILVVCPDGGIVGSELLFYDHVSSFTSASLTAFIDEAGLRVLGSSDLTGSLDGFGVHLLKVGSALSGTRNDDFQDLTSARGVYLKQWANIESSTLRLLDHRDYAIFGTGEYCDLLFAYSPSLIDRAKFFVRDQPIESTFHDKPVVSTDDFMRLQDMPLIAAVNERFWPFVRERFNTGGRIVLHPTEITNQDASL